MSSTVHSGTHQHTSASMVRIMISWLISVPQKFHDRHPMGGSMASPLSPACTTRTPPLCVFCAGKRLQRATQTRKLTVLDADARARVRGEGDVCSARRLDVSISICMCIRCSLRTFNVFRCTLFSPLNNQLLLSDHKQKLLKRELNNKNC